MKTSYHDNWFAIHFKKQKKFLGRREGFFVCFKKKDLLDKNENLFKVCDFDYDTKQW